MKSFDKWSSLHHTGSMYHVTYNIRYTTLILVFLKTSAGHPSRIMLHATAEAAYFGRNQPPEPSLHTAATQKIHLMDCEGVLKFPPTIPTIQRYHKFMIPEPNLFSHNSSRSGGEDRT